MVLGWRGIHTNVLLISVLAFLLCLRLCEHFPILQCLATIATVYWKSNEESVEGDKPQRSQVIRSRESTYKADSRADRVRGNYTIIFIHPNNSFIESNATYSNTLIIERNENFKFFSG